MSATPLGRRLLVAASLIVVATLAAALWTMDSPSTQRNLRLDQRRVNELEQLTSMVSLWHDEHGRLPKTLAELASQPGWSPAVRDPASGQPYEYAVISTRGYRLCAVFATSTAEPDPARRGARWHDARWLHPAGRHCFDREVPRKAAKTSPAEAEKDVAQAAAAAVAP